MTKLHPVNAQVLINVARKEVEKHPCLRFGQALFNALPDEIYREMNGTEYDFFHWGDEKKVLDTFWEHYV